MRITLVLTSGKRKAAGNVARHQSGCTELVSSAESAGFGIPNVQPIGTLSPVQPSVKPGYLDLKKSAQISFFFFLFWVFL